VAATAAEGKTGWTRLRLVNLPGRLVFDSQADFHRFCHATLAVCARGVVCELPAGDLTATGFHPGAVLRTAGLNNVTPVGFKACTEFPGAADGDGVCLLQV
jgi:hypothetical protein